MWRLWNKLFVWHYVRIADDIYRVKKNYNGRYYVRIGEIEMFWLEINLTVNRLGERYKYIPITLKPEELIK